MDNTKLLGPGELIKGAWASYKLRWKVFTGVVLLSGLVIFFLLLLTIGTAGIAGGESKFMEDTPFLLMFPILLIIIVIAILGQIALTHAVISEENIGVLQSYKKAKSSFLPYLVVSVLTGLIILGGLILLIVPGIIWAIWYCFATLVLLAENLEGLDALKKSKEYVKGRTWDVFGRLAFLILIHIVIGIVLTIIFPGKESGARDIASSVINIVMGPISIVYLFLLYKNLKSAAV